MGIGLNFFILTSKIKLCNTIHYNSIFLLIRYKCENGFVTTEAKTRRNENPKWKLSMHGIDIKFYSNYKYMTYTDSEGNRCKDAKLFDERLLKKNLEMYFDLGACNSILAENILDYQTPTTGNCTDRLTNSIIDLLSNLPNIEPNEYYYDDGLDDIELDKIIEKCVPTS